MDERFEELISAFFDGEATAEQRQQVEKLLAENSDARALLDELGTLRTDMKSLPTYRLEQDFADRVVKRIEDAIHQDGNTEPADDHPNARPTPAPSPPPALTDARSDSGLRRGLLWSALTIAAAVLIMIFNNGTVSDPELAYQDGEPKAARATAAKEADQVGPAADVAAAPQSVNRSKRNRDVLMTGPEAGDEINFRKQQPQAPENASQAAQAKAIGDGTYANTDALDPNSFNKKLGAVAKMAPGSTSDNDGIAYFRSTGDAGPAAVRTYLKSQLDAERQSAEGLARRADNELEVDNELKKSKWKERRELATEVPSAVAGVADRKQSAGVGSGGAEIGGVEIVYSIEGTSEQISEILRRLKSGQRAVEFVSAEGPLSDMLASASSSTNQALQGSLESPDEAVGSSRFVEDGADDAATSSKLPGPAVAGGGPPADTPQAASPKLEKSQAAERQLAAGEMGRPAPPAVEVGTAEAEDGEANLDVASKDVASNGVISNGVVSNDEAKNGYRGNADDDKEDSDRPVANAAKTGESSEPNGQRIARRGAQHSRDLSKNKVDGLDVTGDPVAGKAVAQQDRGQREHSRSVEEDSRKNYETDDRSPSGGRGEDGRLVDRADKVEAFSASSDPPAVREGHTKQLQKDAANKLYRILLIVRIDPPGDSPSAAAQIRDQDVSPAQDSQTDLEE